MVQKITDIPDYQPDDLEDDDDNDTAASKLMNLGSIHFGEKLSTTSGDRMVPRNNNFMLHKVYRFVNGNIYYVDVILKYVADHHMMVNVVNNSTHIEYKIYPVTLNANDFMDVFASNQLLGVNKGVLAYFPQDLNPGGNEAPPAYCNHKKPHRPQKFTICQPVAMVMTNKIKGQNITLDAWDCDNYEDKLENNRRRRSH
ncbi:hypothetical protein BC829DRAFT_448435 [Chytridium lagenaria]|nr:hypothetical protein BC829DRAFT_448435 [Chytridium lagenaria]